MRLLFTASLLCLLFTACSENHSRKAPLEASELGVITTATQEEIKDAGFSYSIISENEGFEFYEITNASLDEVNQKLPHALNAKNNFLELMDGPKDLPSETVIQNFRIQNSNSSGFNLEGCFHNPVDLLPIIDFVDESVVPRVLKETDKIQLTSRKSRTANGEDYEFAWAIGAPEGSLISSDFIETTEIELEFDMPGVYSVNLFLRQGVSCHVLTIPLPVTADHEFVEQNPQAELAKLSELSNLKFAQVELMGVKEAQAQSQIQGKDVVVAVLDSGVNYNHPSLAGRIWKNPKEIQNGLDSDDNKRVDDIIGYDFVNDDPYPFDDNGHGSHVAGLIAGTTIGIAQKSTIMPVKVMHAMGRSDTGTVLAGLVYAILNGADVINMSIGAYGIEADMADMYLSVFQAAQKRGVLIVTAAGNGHPETGQPLNIDQIPMFPAALSFNNILSIGASDYEGNLTYYSNYGPEAVDLVAVGGRDFDLVTRQPVDELLYSAYIANPSGRLLNPAMGTSMATPIVAGMAAFLIGEDPSLNPQDITDLLKGSSDKVDALSGLIKSSGLANLNSALEGLKARSTAQIED